MPTVWGVAKLELLDHLIRHTTLGEIVADLLGRLGLKLRLEKRQRQFIHREQAFAAIAGLAFTLCIRTLPCALEWCQFDASPIGEHL